MSHPNLLNQQNAALVVVDIQEGFRPMLADFDKIAERAARMVRGCQIRGEDGQPLSACAHAVAPALEAGGTT